MARLDVTSNGLETVIFNLKEMIGIVDLRWMGYYELNRVYYTKSK